MKVVRAFRPVAAVLFSIVALFLTGFTATPVAAKTSSTAIASSPNPSVFGQSDTLTATVTGSGGTPTGSVTFRDSTLSTTLGNVTINASGIAKIPVSTLSVGSHVLYARYSGDANGFPASSSPTLTQTVNKASTTTALATSPNPSVVGQSVTLTATLAAVAPGAGTPSGTVTFKDGATTLGTGTLSAGIATFPTSVLSAGGHSLTAVYGGDASFATSTSSAQSQVVGWTITASAGANGTITPSGSSIVTNGGTKSFTITPNACYSIASVLVDGVSVGSVSSYTFTNVTAGHTISASFALNTYTIAASAGAGGSVSPAGNVSVNCGANRAFTITPNACYSIASVLVDGVSVGAVSSYTFSNVTAGHTIATSFTLNTFTVAASAGSGGAISPAGNVSVNCGADEAFTITPDGCHTLADVLVDGVSVGAVASYTFTNATAGHTIAASFTLNTHSIAASAAAGGAISPSGDVAVNCGTNRTFAITPAPCYSIADVQVDGVSVGAVTSYTFTNVTAGHTVAASFTLDTHTIAASAGAGGAISQSGSVTVDCGADQAFMITPDDCHTIAGVLVDGVPVGAVASYTFTNVTAGHAIAASFAIKTNAIVATPDAGGSISPNGSVSVDCGANQVFTITADGCHTLADVLVDGVSVGAVASHTFTDVTAGHTITASFTLNQHTIAASAGPEGSISPNGDVAVNCGADQAFAITPAAHFHVADVVVDGVSVGAVTSYTVSNVTGAHTISATFAIDTYAILASAGANGSVNPAGTTPVAHGGELAYTITPAAHYHVADVLVDGVSVGAVASYTFTNVTAAHTIAASFAIDTYAITATAGANGSVSPAGSTNVDHGSELAYAITPNAHYHVADVLVDGASVGAVTSYTFTNVTEAHTIAASFAIDTYTITASAGANGAISPAGATSVEHGSELAFAITPAAHYHAADVLVDGASVGAVASYTFTNVTEAHTIAASFAIDTYTITASAGANGTVSPVGATGVDHGSDLAYTITPNEHFHVADVLVDGASVGAVTSYTFSNVTGAHTIAASFAIDTYAITASAGANGSVTPAGATSVDHGGELAYTITAAAHYHVADVLVDGASVGAVESYTFTNVTGAHTIAASFAIDTYAITASAGANGSVSPAGATSVDHGSQLVYTITPAAHYHVADVLVDGASVGAVESYTFSNVTEAHTIAASFAIDTYAIAAAAGANGSVSPAGATSVDHGASLAYTITPAAHYHVADVLVDGASIGAVASYTFAGVTGPHTLVASFAIDTYAITASAGTNGSVSPAGATSVDHGASLAYTITPAAHYHVADVLVDGASIGAVASYTFVAVTGPHTISASFAIDTWTITTSAGANGSVSPAGATSVDHGAGLAINVVPAAHYHVANVLVDGVSVGAVTGFTFSNVTANHTLSASFAIDTYTITASAGANGSVSPAGASSVAFGAGQVVTVTPAAHYHVADVLVDGASVGAVTSFTFSNVTGNHTISASFAIDTWTITASAGANGAISPTGAVVVNHGAGQAFTVTPAAHFHVADVLVDGTSVGPVTSFAFTNVAGNHTISASFAIDTYTITAAAGANGSISPAGAVVVNHGADQAFTITPAAHFHVASVLVDGVPVGAVTSYAFTSVTGSHTISASFAIDTWTIAASAGANGAISPAGAVVVNHGAAQVFSVTPAAHFHVADVVVDGASVGPVTSYTFSNVAANHTIAASFAIDTWTLAASAGANGSISPAGAVVVNHGAGQVFTITPAAQFHVADVLVDGASVGPVASYTFTNVTANHTIAASFAIDTWTLTASAGANGSISPAGAVVVDHGAAQVFTVTPAAHFHVADVLVDGASVGPVGSYTFTNVTGSHSIAASFAIDTWTLTASAGANGSISPAGAVVVNHGAGQVFTIAPAAHFHIANVLVDGVSVGVPTSYTFTNVTGNHTITASFAIDTWTITAAAGANGSISPAGEIGVDHGAGQAFTIVPAAHYHVANVLVDGASVGAVTSFTFTNVTGNHTIAASFAIDTWTIAAAAGANGSISPAGAVTVNHADAQVFTITPSAHFHVADVLVDGASVGAVTSFTFSNVTGDHTIAASFAINTRTLALVTAGNGTVSRDPELALYDEMSTVTLTAHPAAGWTFAGWSGGATGDSAAVAVVMDADKTVTATFRDIDAPVASLTAPNGGEVLSAGSVATITWTASDNLGVTNILLEFSADGGASWSPIADGLGNSGSFECVVPPLPTTAARVRVTARDAAGNTASDISDADFEIQNTSAITNILAMRADSSSGAGCYPIPGAAGPWRDLGGRYHGALMNFTGTMASGWNGDATPETPERLEFTGAEAVAIPAGSVAELQSAAPVTAELWFRTSHDQPVAGQVETLLEWLQTGNRGMSIALTGGQLVVDLGGWVPMGAVQPDTWYHVAVAKDTARVRVYLNGQRVFTGNNPFLGVQQSPIGIGASVRGFVPQAEEGPKGGGHHTFNASPNGFANFFTGAIAQVQVWQGAMNDAQVRGRFTADRGRYPVSSALPAAVRVVSLDASQADGVNVGAMPNVSSPWVDLIAPATNADLIGFSGAPQSGWQGNGIAGSPYRLQFDGFNDVVSIPGAAIPELLKARALSAEMWFQTPGTMYGFQVRYLMQWLAGLGSDRGLSLAIRNSQLMLAQKNLAWQELGTLQPNTWYHVIVAKLPGETRVYLNGARLFTSGSVQFGVPYTAVTIGASTLRGNGVYADFFTGAVAQVHLWLGAVDDTTAQAAYAAAAPAYQPAPVADPAALSGHSTPVALALGGMPSNPVRGALSVRFSLPNSESANLEMLDITGRMVRSAAVGAFGPGQHTVTLGQAHEIPAGIYWVRLRQSGRTLTTKTAVVH